ncbi:hypothetical protein AAHH84_00245 [Candidatus Hodgkinia cicadicola]
MVRARARGLAQLKHRSTVLKQLNPKYQFSASARKAEAKLKQNAVKQPVLASELASFVLSTSWHNKTAWFGWRARWQHSRQQDVPWNENCGSWAPQNATSQFVYCLSFLFHPSSKS